MGAHTDAAEEAGEHEDRVIACPRGAYRAEDVADADREPHLPAAEHVREFAPTQGTDNGAD